MADWSLSFRGAQRIAIARWEQLLSAVVGPVTTTYGEWVGNPRDFYSRTIAVTGRRDDVPVEMSLSENERGSGDPESYIDESPRVSLGASTGPFASRLAIWHALRDAFAGIGCIDQTLVTCGAAIVDDAEAAGEVALAERLRTEITVALVAAAPGLVISLRSMRPDDLETVLAAHASPEIVRSLWLSNCKLSASPTGVARFPNIEDLRLEEMRPEDIETVLAVLARPEIVRSVWLANRKPSALPAGLARFANIETLSVDELEPTGPVLRGLSLPKLTALSIRGIRRLSRDDVAASPLLAVLNFENSALEELDPDIIEMCPKINRVFLLGTPLSKDRDKMDILWARWKGVEWTPPRPRVRAVSAAPPTPPRAKARGKAPAPPRKSRPGVGRAVAAIVPGDELRPFFEALIAAPQDDASRLALARYLTERGDERGELIRRACELDELKRRRIGAAVGVVPPPDRRIEFGSGILELAGGYLTIDEIRALIDSGACRTARTVVFSYYCIGNIGDDIVAHLARSGAFPSLRELRLDNMGLTNAGARTLARGAVGLEHLEHLNLGDIGATDSPGVSDKVVDELARSHRLPALLTITRIKEHRPDTPEAHEGTEVTPIKRDDGSVVESTINHWTFQ